MKRVATRLETDLMENLDAVAEAEYGGNRARAVRAAVRLLIMDNLHVFQMEDKPETATTYA